MKSAVWTLNSRSVFAGTVTHRPVRFAAFASMCTCLCCCKDTGGR